jgi:hypothetical protein
MLSCLLYPPAQGSKYWLCPRFNLSDDSEEEITRKQALVTPSFASIDPANSKRNEHKKHIIGNLVNGTRGLNTYAVIFIDTQGYTKSSLLALHARLRSAVPSQDLNSDDDDMSDNGPEGNSATATATARDADTTVGDRRNPRRSRDSTPPQEYNLSTDSE